MHPLLAQIRSTLTTAIFTAAFSSMSQMLGMLILLFIPLCIWLLYSLYILLRRPERRLAQGLKILIWAIAIVCIVTVHAVRKDKAQAQADQWVSAILTYQQQHGHYPANLEMLGFSKTDAQSFGTVRYHYGLTQGKPFLLYMGTEMVYSVYQYDFEKNIWVFSAD